MGYKYQGDAVLNVSLTVDAPKPLDVRSVVNNVSELYDIPAKTAYPGMTVANVDNGNIYMLVDKSKINEQAGWKASYESIQIITCTEEEYNTWKTNTTDDFKPIDESLTYLHAETYYYIKEDSIKLLDGSYYLTSTWGKDIEDQLSSKATASSVESLLAEVTKDKEDLANNYTKTADLIETYATKELVNSLLNLESEDSFISQTLSKYYTSEEVDSKFVTIESLGGDLEGLEGENFVFVTSAQYKTDQEKIQEELSKTLKLDGEGSLDKITINQIKSPVGEDEEQLIVDIKPDGLYVNDNIVALDQDIPNLVTLEESDYNSRLEAGTLDPDTYYYVYNTSDPNAVYVTLRQLEDSYDNRSTYQNWVVNRCYDKTEINNKLKEYQSSGNYVVNDQLNNYYTIEQINSNFLTKTHIESNYATKQNLTDLQTEISTNYVTITMLKGTDTDDTDFMFVTQSQYSDDKAAQALEIQSNEIISTKTTTSEITIQKIEEKEVIQEGTDETIIEQEVISSVHLSTNDNKLLIGEQIVAYSSDVPKIECITQTDYDQKVKDGTLEDDTYYYTYDVTGVPANIYVTQAMLQENYVPTAQVAQMIQDAVAPLLSRIEALEALHVTE